MKTKINICTEEWCNLVFEGKNKDYGAFELRQMTTKRRSLALLLSIFIFTLGVCAPALIRSMSHGTKSHFSESNQLADLSKLKVDEIKPNIDMPMPEPQRTIRFTPPIVAEDVDPEESQPPSNDEMFHSSANISITDQNTTDDVNTVVDLSIVERPLPPIDFAEQMPMFAGGDDARLAFLKENLRYPSVANDMGISGKVILKFVVEKDGRITNISVLRGIGAGCDEEAIRVVKLMPTWSPGRQNGKAVSVNFIMPITFRLQEQ